MLNWFLRLIPLKRQIWQGCKNLTNEEAARMFGIQVCALTLHFVSLVTRLGGDSLTFQASEGKNLN